MLGFEDCAYLKALYKKQRIKEITTDILHDVPADALEKEPNDEAEFTYHYRQSFIKKELGPSGRHIKFKWADPKE